ncbi:Ig-like domain-containing protein [Paraburkholderia tuberum]|uniref:Ig-like domain-containing protein n=1 Tax=Paraburkholderia tuberum TaxID=157910 RepID=UPI00244A0E0D|nr:Ig-like domain-containing protein [Paraburkholderia tuberum]
MGNGESTDDTTPTLVGKGEPGDTIVVIDNGTPIGETQVDEDGNWSFTPDTPLDEGEHEFTVVERDPAGNESRPSEPHVVIVDTTAPDQPVIGEVIDDEGPIQGPVGNGESTDDTTPTLVGKGEPGDTIVVIDNGTPVGETEVDEDGNWSFTPDTPLDEGEHEFTVVERDPAGNESKPSEPHVVIVDTTAPDQPVIGEVIDDEGPIQGPVGNGESTDDTTPTLVGKGEPGDTIIVIDNGTPVGETEVDEDGNWSFTPDTPLDEGEHEFTVVERDPAGNESGPSEPHVVVVDTTAPDQPVIGEVIDDEGPVQGPVGNGESTDDTTPTLVGKGEPGDTIIVIDNGTPVGETQVDEDGNWSFTPDTPLDEGEHEFTVVERDPAGNESGPSEPHVVIVDTTAPDQPVIGEVIDDVGLVQGPVGNGESTDDTTPTLVGKGEPGDTIIVIDNGTPVGETEVDEDGNWSFTPDTPLDEGEHEFTVVERDPAGNESRPSEPHVVIVDTTAPDQPVIGEVIDDVGLVQGPVGNGESTDDTTPTLVGKGEPGDTIIVIDNGTPIGETQVDEDGNWSFTPDTPLDEGEHEFTVVERDPAGNESGPSEPHVVVVDTTAPDQPVIGEVIDDEGPVQGPVGNGESTDDTTPTLVGKGEPGDTIIVIDNGTPVGETQVDEDGNWSFTPDTPLDEGEHEFTVVERDPAGNESGPSEPHVVIVDTTAPDQPVIGEVIDDVGLVQGPVDNGGSTDDTTPTLVGKGEPGDTIVVIDNGTPVGETQVDEDGNWSFTPDTPLDEGEHEFTVVERDPAGNESGPSEPHVVVVDTTAPDQPVIGEVIDDEGPIQGPVGNGESTDDTTPTLVGKGEPGDTIVVIDNGTPVGETQVDEDGNWSFTPDTPLDEGEHEFTVVERDPAGNESRPSEPHVVIVDTTAPDQPVIGEVIDDEGPIQGPVGNGESTDDTTPTLVGKGEPGDTIIVIDNGTPVGETQVDEDGNWSFTPDTPLGEGEHEFTVVERDPAGNESRPSEPHVVIVDTTAPDQPVIGEVIDDEGPIQGPVGNGESTDDTTPTLVGKGEPGDTIIVIDNGTPVGETEVDEDGNWSFTPDTPLDEGEHEFTVVERDPAGNESGPSEPHVVVVDTTAPDQPVIGEVIDDEGPVQGPVGNGESTDDTTPTLVGKGEPGDTIIVIDNGTPVGETQVDEDGNWSFTPDTPLDEGEHEFTVVERDPAGNESGPSEPHVVIVDTTAPDQPVIGEVIDDVGLVQGPVDNGGSTDDTTPTLVGKGEPGDTIVVIDNGTPVGETQVDEDGNWSFTPDTPLDEGEHEFTVVERDPAGNESGPSEPHVVVVDTTAPDQPVIGEVIDDEGPIQGPVGNGESTDDTTPTLVGKGEPGDTIVVIDNGTPVGETQVDEDGNWSFTPDTPLDEGEHEFTVVERDPAGNESRPSEPHVVIVDTTAPDQPVIGEVIDDEGPIQGPVGNGESTDDTTPTLVGKGEPGDTIIVIDNGTPVGETQVDEDGNWSFTPDTPLGEGEHEFTVVERDPAGNESRPSEPHVVIVDTTAPDQPVIGEVIDDEGPIQGPVGNGESTDDTTPTLVGKGEPGDTIIVIDNGTPVGETEVDEDGNWSFTPDTPLDEGEHQFTVVERDEAGNESRPSESHVVIVDTTPPVIRPVIWAVIDDVGPLKGVISPGGTSDDTQPKIWGSAEPGSTVTVYDGDQVLGQTTADDDGNWSFTPEQPLAYGPHELTAVATGAAGNQSEPSEPFGFSLGADTPTVIYEDFSGAPVGSLGKGLTLGLLHISTINQASDWQGISPAGFVGPITKPTSNALGVCGAVYVGLEDGYTASSITFTVGDSDTSGNVIRFIGTDGKIILTGTFGSKTAHTVTFTMPEGMVFTGFQLVSGSNGTQAGGKDYFFVDDIAITLETFGGGVTGLSITEEEQSADAVVMSVEDVADDAVVDQDAVLDQDITSGQNPVADHDTQDSQEATAEADPVVPAESVLAVQDDGQVHVEHDGEGEILDLTRIGQTPLSVEVIDLTGTGDNTLKLSLGDVLEQGGKDLFIADGRTQVMVKGDAGDKVELSDLLPDGEDIGDWTQQSGNATVDGIEYDVFYHSGLNAELLVQHGVETVLNNH